MSILFYCDWPNKKTWLKAFEKKFKKEKIYFWPNIKQNDQINYAIVWNILPGKLKNYKNLKIIFSLGAGVDHLLKDKDLPKVPLVRLKDPLMGERMSNYLVSQILNYQIQMFKYFENNKKNKWEEDLDVLDNRDLTIGILGYGYLASFAAKDLLHKGYKLLGYKRTKLNKKSNFPIYYSKKKLKKFISKSNIIINLLPNTKKTKNFINKSFLNNMKKKSMLINVGRGSTIDEKSLINHVKKNKEFFAVLDVFKNEPLKKNHSLWKYKNIIITPHIASITNIKSGVNQIYNIYKNFNKTGKLTNTVDMSEKY